MRMECAVSRGAAVIVLIAGFLFSSQAASQQKSLTDLRKYYEKLTGGPYLLLEAPRTDLGVGTIFILSRGKTLYYTRPEDCFTAELLSKVSGKVAVPGESSISANLDWKAGLQIANVTPITDPLAAEMKSQRVTSVQLTISQLTRRLLTIADLKKNFRTVTDIDCKDSLSPDAKPSRSVIVEALYAHSMDLTFKNSEGRDVALSVGLLSQYFPTFNFGGKTTWAGAIRFTDEDHIIAIKSLLTKDAVSFSSSSEPEFLPLNPATFYGNFE